MAINREFYMYQSIDNAMPFVKAGAPETPPVPELMTRAWLEERFGAQESPGWSEVIQIRGGQQIFSRSREPACLCWGIAKEVISDLGEDRATLSGYSCETGSNSVMSTVTDGHDFALVDGRFLVDGWAAHVESLTTQAVLDLMDPIDYAHALRLHEPIASWTVKPTQICDDLASTAHAIEQAITELGVSATDAKVIRIFADECLGGDYVLSALAYSAGSIKVRSVPAIANRSRFKERDHWNLIYAGENRSTLAQGPVWDRISHCSKSVFQYP